MPWFVPHWGRLRADLAEAERWLLPGECLLCLGPASPQATDPLVCAVCRARFRGLPSLRCARCGQPGMPEVACRLCADWPPALRRVESGVWLDERARHAVHLFKYEGWTRLAEIFALSMRTLAPVLRAEAVLIPLPLGAARLRARGYNQSALLAGSLGRLTGRAVRDDVLRRRRETATQTRLTPEARAANVRGAFTAAAAPRRVVVVDDVCTTGATLVAAAGALALAGAEIIEAVTFARAELPLAALGRGR